MLTNLLELLSNRKDIRNLMEIDRKKNTHKQNDPTRKPNNERTNEQEKDRKKETQPKKK